MKPLLLLTAALAIAGCGLLGGSSASVSGRTFLSTGVTVDGAPMALVNGTQVRLTFAKDGNLSAQVGCNTMGGAYRLDGAILRFQDGAITAMGCDPDRHAQDDWLFGFLGSGPSVALAANQLVLTAGDTVVTLVDRELAEPDLPLV